MSQFQALRLWLRRTRRPLAALSLFAAATALPAPAQASPYGELTLSNGLRIVVIHDHRLPVVSHSIWYRVGSADEREGEAGLAHFLEHLMFKGTTRNPAVLFQRYPVLNGGVMNATTTADWTNYYQRVPKTHLGKLMELEADRMTGLKLAEADVNVERGAVLEELKRFMNEPSFALSVATKEAANGASPYGRHPIGREAEIKAMTYAAALAFYKRYYAPNNAVVVIAGDVTLEEVRRLADSTYGQVARRDVVAPPAPSEKLAPVQSRVVVPHPQMRAPHVSIRFALPGAAQLGDDDEAALALLGSVVSSGPTSRLSRLLVQTHIATSAGAGRTVYRGSGRFAFNANAASGVSAETLEKAIRAIIADVRTAGITEAELEEIRPWIVRGREERLDNQFGRLETVGEVLMLGRPLASVTGWDARIDRLTAADLNRVARRYLLDEVSLTAHLVPAGGQ